MPKILNSLIKNLKNQDNPLPALVDEYLFKRDKSPNRLREYNIDMVPRHRPPGRIGASSVGGCQRLAIYKFLGVPGKYRLDPQLELKFEDGNWRHHKWQAMFEDMQLVLGEDRFKVLGVEERIEIPELKIVGHLDNRLHMEDFGEVIVDIKGINDRGFLWLIQNAKPKEQHVSQILTYGKAKGLDKGIIIYDNKNDQSTKMWIVDNNEMAWVNVQAWVKDVLEYLEGKKLPKKHPDCKQGVYLWSKCPWSHICFGDHDEEKAERYVYGRKWERN